MQQSFTDKLYYVYFRMGKNRGKSGFRAFCILLRGIDFSPNEKFVEKILADISKQQNVCKSLLTGKDKEFRLSPKFYLKAQDIEYIFEALLFLKTRISTRLMHSLCAYIKNPHQSHYLRQLFFSYFNALKSGKLFTVEQQGIKALMKYLKNNIPAPTNKKSFNYGPRIATNSGIWGNTISGYITSIPMGGMNKKY